MKIRVMSDLHLEWYPDKGKSFIEGLEVGEEDVLILAGDITSYSRITDTLKSFCAKFPHVGYVLGNHEYYDAPSRAHVRQAVFDAEEQTNNLFWLDNDSSCIEGQWFHGGTMWFRNNQNARAFKLGMNDFHCIRDFEKWVYEENMGFIKLAQEATKGDVWVTHHLPSFRSVAPIYLTNKLNAFFVCNMEDLIREQQPALWIHGHTHESCDYSIGDTRVVCNPFGYVGHEVCKTFKKDFVVEV